MGRALANFSYALLFQFFLLSSAFSVSQAAQPIIKANVSQIIQNRQPVQVNIRDVQKPTAADVVALYLSGDPDLKNSVPLKYRWLTDAKGYLQSGSADLRYCSLLASIAFGFFRSSFAVHASGCACHGMLRRDMSNGCRSGHLVASLSPTLSIPTRPWFA